VPSEKRARQRELRAQKQAIIQAQRKRRRLVKRIITFTLLAAAVVAIAILFQISGNKSGTKTTTTTSTSTSSTSTTSTVPPSTLPVPSTTFAVPTTQPLTSVAVVPTCPPATGSKTRVTWFTKAPPNCIGATTVYDATFDTSAGTFVVQMDAAKSYAAVNNFVFLALYQYYNGTLFHRVIPGFVDQGGDPTGLGTGGPHGLPGYSYTGNTPPASCKTAPTGPDCYKLGDFVMANTGAPTSNGSQFFLIIPNGQNVLNTEPNYTDFGHVISGQPVVDKIGEWGSSSGTPRVKVYVLKVTISQVKAKS